MHAILRKLALVAAAIFYIGSGILHFLRWYLYAKIVPPFIPWPVAMVYISGIAEIAG